MRRAAIALALGVCLAASMASGASAHAASRRVWVRNEWGRKVLVCERWERVFYMGPGKHYAWVPVKCKA